MAERLHPEDEKELRFCSRAQTVSMPGVLLRVALAELNAVRAERDAAIKRANEVPGLSAALDEARWERDVAKGERTAGSQALAEIERLLAELADVRARFEEKLREPIPLRAELAEVCICAAIRMPDGHIVRGQRHCHCIAVAHDMPRYREAWECPFGDDQGFVTSRGRYVTREEGRALQDAAGIASAAEGGYRGATLFSEDLY